MMIYFGVLVGECNVVGECWRHAC